MRRDASLYKKKVVVLTALVFIAASLGMVTASKELRQVAFAATPTAQTGTAVVALRTPSPTVATVEPSAATATHTPPPATPTVTPTETPAPTLASPTATPTLPPSPTPTPTATPPPPPTSTPTATPSPSPVPTPATPTLPVNPSLSDELAVPTIVAPRDGLETGEGKVVIEGNAPADAVVVVYDGDVPLGVTRADAQGKWRLEPEKPLAEGKHLLTARTTDGQQVSRPSATVQVVVLGERLPVTGGERP